MFALGFVSATGFEPLGLWAVTLGCLGLMTVSVADAPSPRSAAARGYWFGVGHFTLGLNWIAGAFQFQDAMPHWLGWFAVVALSLYIGVYPAIAALIARLLVKSPRAPRQWLPFTLVFGGAWIVSEFLRATVFTGFAWNPLGVIWLPIVGVPRAFAPLVGTYGLGGITILIAGLLAAFVPRWIARVRADIAAGQGEWLSAALAPVALAAFLTLGAYSMKHVVAHPVGSGARVRIVQPNIGQQDKHQPAYEKTNFTKLAALSGVPGNAPRLILWPEAAVPDYLEDEPRARQRIAELIGSRDMIMTGGVALIYDKAGDLVAARNSLFTLNAQAEITARYDKSHLVPYGEYLPMKPLLSAIGLSRLVPGTVDFLPGPGAQSLSVAGFGEVGVQICYEIIFSGDVVDAANRPDFLFNPSNDAWFGAWGPVQHLAQARLRAIEEGITVVRSTPTGISAIIDPQGRVVRALPYHTAGFIDAKLPISDRPTLFARLGNWLPAALALILFAGGIAIARKRR